MKPRHLFGILICITMIAGFSCGKSSSGDTTPPVTPPPTDPTVNISIYNMDYGPASVTVKKGTVVKWTNADGYAHTVTSNDDVTFDSGNINAGRTYSYTTTTEGTFPYHCTIHGFSMAGTLVVTP